MPFYILSLDGGGSLGVYTLGVLSEVQKMLGAPLHEVFDLVYGTSTGSIIGTLIALGSDIDTIRDHYFDVVEDVMARYGRRGKSRALHKHAKCVYRNKKFDEFLIRVGIVATHLEYNRPMVFKNDVSQAHGSRGSFESGFGCEIADAVVASCAAFPFFSAKFLSTPNHGDREVVDGGFVANNPTLFALADALGPLNVARSNIRVLSLGTGNYPEKGRLLRRAFSSFGTTSTVMTLLRTSSNTVETVRRLLFSDIYTLRIDESFADKAYKTDFLESDPDMLRKIFQLGRESFGKNEDDLRGFWK